MEGVRGLEGVRGVGSLEYGGLGYGGSLEVEVCITPTSGIWLNFQIF